MEGGRSHQEAVGALYRQVADVLDASDCRVLVALIDVRLPQDDQDDATVETVVQPDLLVVCDPAKVDERAVRGAPDSVVEVLSPATPRPFTTTSASGGSTNAME
jgi:Uma2 family endonuclease